MFDVLPWAFAGQQVDSGANEWQSHLLQTTKYLSDALAEGSSAVCFLCALQRTQQIGQEGA